MEELTSVACHGLENRTSERAWGFESLFFRSTGESTRLPSIPVQPDLPCGGKALVWSSEK